jgi:hypothetical protein
VNRIGRFSMVGWRWVSPVHRVDSWGWTWVGRDPRRVVIGGFTWTHIGLRRWTGVVVRGWGRLGIASEGVVGRLARLHVASDDLLRWNTDPEEVATFQLCYLRWMLFNVEKLIHGSRNNLPLWTICWHETSITY